MTTTDQHPFDKVDKDINNILTHYAPCLICNECCYEKHMACLINILKAKCYFVKVKIWERTHGHK